MITQAVAEWGLSDAVGPLNIGVLAAGGAEDSILQDSSGKLAEVVDAEVKYLIEAALEVAIEVISCNRCVKAKLCIFPVGQTTRMLLGQGMHGSEANASRTHPQYHNLCMRRPGFCFLVHEHVW